MPAARWLRAAQARAQRPNAPSTCTQAPSRLRERNDRGEVVEGAGVDLPRLQDGDGPGLRPSRACPAKPRPDHAALASVGMRITRSWPRPRNCSAENTVVWASSPISTVIGGAPNRPCASTSQPAWRSTSPRAAARQTKLATVAPVTKPTELSRGRSRRSSSQPPATVSTAAAAGARVVVAGVLAPGAGQPVGRDADRMGAADDPAEKARPGHRVNAGFYPRDQLVEHAQASTALLGERFAQGLNSFTIVLLRSLQPIGQVVAVARGVTGRSTEKLVCRAFRHDVPQKDDASV